MSGHPASFLTTRSLRLQYPKFPVRFRSMSTSRQSPSAATPKQRTKMEQTCQHTRVRVVARDEESEFVECLDCAEVFEASEFKDMAIEERTKLDES